MTGIFTISYFPNITTSAKLYDVGEIRIEQYENFIKQSFRSRCKILGPNDILTLRVPVLEGRKNIPIKEIRIDNKQRWQNNHWRSITSSYSKSPFFEHYQHLVKKVIYNKYEHLFDLAIASMQICFSMIGAPLILKYTDSYQHNYSSPIKDYRVILHENKGSEHTDIFSLVSYHQNFGKLFVPNLSVLDLIFCEGPIAINILTGHANDTRMNI